MTNRKRTLPKLNIKKIITQDAVASVAGKPGIYASHTDGVNCDTSKGCNC